VEVALELGEERRRAGTGAARIGRGPWPFIGAGGGQSPGIQWPASMPGLGDASYPE
jgi:hypothetical protein